MRDLIHDIIHVVTDPIVLVLVTFKLFSPKKTARLSTTGAHGQTRSYWSIDIGGGTFGELTAAMYLPINSLWINAVVSLHMAHTPADPQRVMWLAGPMAIFHTHLRRNSSARDGHGRKMPP